MITEQVSVEIHGEKGAFKKPFSNEVVSLILDLSGRKNWKNTETIFDATPHNLDIIKSSCENIKFIDDGSP